MMVFIHMYNEQICSLIILNPLYEVSYLIDSRKKAMSCIRKTLVQHLKEAKNSTGTRDPKLAFILSIQFLIPLHTHYNHLIREVIRSWIRLIFPFKHRTYIALVLVSLFYIFINATVIVIHHLL